jgi:hypothetical protein
MHVAQKGAVQGDACLIGSTQIGRAHAPAVTGSLHKHLMRGALDPQQHRQAGHAFAADDTDLDARLVGPIGDHGSKPALGEIDMVDTFLARLEDPAHRQIDGLQVRLEKAEILAR